MNKISGELQALIEKECQGKTNIKLTIGTLVDGEKTIQVFGHGGEVANEDYLYEIGSITKTFTTSLLAKLIHEGVMSLDDAISKYFDGLDGDYYPTLRRLATHTAGYGHYPASFLDGFKSLILPRVTGSRNGGVLPGFVEIDEKKMKKLLHENKKEDKDYPWAYSNFGLGLVGYALGKASGAGYQAAMGEFLKNDLEMPNSFTHVKNSTLQAYDRKNRKIGNWDFSNTVLDGTGCINSTAEDMLTYAGKQMDGSSYLSLAHEIKTSISKKYGSGLAWVIDKDNTQLIMHGGGTGGFDSLLIIDKQKKNAVVVLSNYIINMNKIITAVLKELES